MALDPANAGTDILPAVWPVRGFRADVLPESFAARIGLFSFDAGSPEKAGADRVARLKERIAGMLQKRLEANQAAASRLQ